MCYILKISVDQLFLKTRGVLLFGVVLLLTHNLLDNIGITNNKCIV